MVVARAYVGDENAMPINLCVYVSLWIAVIALYNSAREKYGRIDKFHTIRGLCVICMFAFACVIVAILFKIWEPSTKANDIATLLALLLSLSQKILIDWMGRYLNG